MPMVQVVDNITIRKKGHHTPEGKYTIWKKKTSPLRGDC